jgi:uncharacterized protein YndB with AHSA1/START domain
MKLHNSTDRIEKTLRLRAPRSRVWRALTDSAEFGAWFGAALDGPFAPGALVTGRITIRGYEHVRFEVRVERVEPESLFSYRWHPYAVDPKVDYSAEIPTLVEFRLADEGGGTRLTVVESGFDRLPAHRRDEAFRMNEGGWKGQLENVRRHVDGDHVDG